MVDESDPGVTPEDPEAASPDRDETSAPAPRTSSDRRSLDEVFGDVLPDPTRDDRAELPDQSRDDELLRDVPPHHG